MFGFNIFINTTVLLRAYISCKQFLLFEIDVSVTFSVVPFSLFLLFLSLSLSFFLSFFLFASLLFFWENDFRTVSDKSDYFKSSISFILSRET